MVNPVVSNPVQFTTNEIRNLKVVSKSSSLSGVIMTLQLSAITPKVNVHNGKVITTSQDVADYFGKLHKDVLRKIESLECSIEFTSAHFYAHVQKIDIGNGATRESKVYHMTKNGFIFLVMGFTGKKAAQFKEAYIAEFDRMEAELIARRYRSINNLSSSEDLIALVDKLQKVIHEGEFIPAGQTINEYNLPILDKVLAHVEMSQEDQERLKQECANAMA
ncbi:Rha family transcriptional regulator [Arsenophonus sp.]|uniref:Rha family transcriptional regulator n=1 Tax=Arsenophonus sp. TaxID=1872640 RepID=UPI003879D44D